MKFNAFLREVCVTMVPQTQSRMKEAKMDCFSSPNRSEYETTRLGIELYGGTIQGI